MYCQLITVHSNYFINIKWYIYTNTKPQFSIWYDIKHCLTIELQTESPIYFQISHYLNSINWLYGWIFTVPLGLEANLLYSQRMQIRFLVPLPTSIRTHRNETKKKRCYELNKSQPINCIVTKEVNRLTMGLAQGLLASALKKKQVIEILCRNHSCQTTKSGGRFPFPFGCKRLLYQRGRLISWLVSR